MKPEELRSRMRGVQVVLVTPMLSERSDNVGYGNLMIMGT